MTKSFFIILIVSSFTISLIAEPSLVLINDVDQIQYEVSVIDIVEGKIDESVEKQLKPKLKACLQRLIDNNLPELPDTLYLSNIYNNNNGDLILRLCPS